MNTHCPLRLATGLPARAPPESPGIPRNPGVFVPPQIYFYLWNLSHWLQDDFGLG